MRIIKRCSVCGGFWGAERPACDVTGTCEAGYPVDVAEAVVEAAREYEQSWVAQDQTVGPRGRPLKEWRRIKGRHSRAGHALVNAVRALDAVPRLIAQEDGDE